jgi:hypothetical protein
MTMMDRETVRKLAEVEASPAVSIFVSRPSRSGSPIQSQTRIRNIFASAEERTLAAGHTQETVTEMFKPARELVSENFLWDHHAKSLAIFVSPSTMVINQVPIEIKQSVYISDRFYIKPLLGMLLENRHIYVLALSRNQTKLIEGEPNRGLVILEQHFKDDTSPDKRSLQFSTGSPSRSPKGARRTPLYHGHAKEIDDGHIRERDFLRKVDLEVNNRISDPSTPLVVAAVTRLGANYRQISRYPSLMTTIIEGNPKQLTPNELLDRAWPIVEAHIRERQRQEVAQFQELKETEMSSDDIRKVVPASCNARVDKLFMRRGEQIWGRYDQTNEQVSWADPESKEARDLLNFAATNSFRQGAHVFLLPKELMPTDKPIAALFRYPRRMHDTV